MKFKIVKEIDWRYYNLNGKLIREEGQYFVKRNGLFSRFYPNAYLYLSGDIGYGGKIMFVTKVLASKFSFREDAERFVKSLAAFPEKYEIMK